MQTKRGGERRGATGREREREEERREERDMGKGERVNVRHNATTASSQKIVASSHGRVCSNGTITRSLTLHRKLGKSGQSMNVNEARARTNKPWLAQNHNSKFARYRRATLQHLGPWNVGSRVTQQQQVHRPRPTTVHRPRPTTTQQRMKHSNSKTQNFRACSWSYFTYPR